MSSTARVTVMSLPRRLARSASLVRTRAAPIRSPSAQSASRPRRRRARSALSTTEETPEMGISQRHSFGSCDQTPSADAPPRPPRPGRARAPADPPRPFPTRPRTQARTLAAQHAPAMKPAAAAPIVASSSFSHHHHQHHHRRSAATTTAAHRSAGSGLPPLSFDEGGKWGGGKGKSVVWVPSTAKAGQAMAYGGQAQQQQHGGGRAVVPVPAPAPAGGGWPAPAVPTAGVRPARGTAAPAAAAASRRRPPVHRE